jgi:hypothetical protein
MRQTWLSMRRRRCARPSHPKQGNRSKRFPVPMTS